MVSFICFLLKCCSRLLLNEWNLIHIAFDTYVFHASQIPPHTMKCPPIYWCTSQANIGGCISYIRQYTRILPSARNRLNILSMLKCMCYHSRTGNVVPVWPNKVLHDEVEGWAPSHEEDNRHWYLHEAIVSSCVSSHSMT